MVAAGTSAVVFPILYVLGFSTTVCSIAAFVAGAIPNWTLNRRWTWKVEGRVAFGREVIAYIVISAATLVILSLVTGWTHRPGAVDSGRPRDPRAARDGVVLRACWRRSTG